MWQINIFDSYLDFWYLKYMLKVILLLLKVETKDFSPTFQESF